MVAEGVGGRTPGVNLHITLTPFVHESRLLKESASLVRAGVAERVIVAALHEPGLAEHEQIDDRRRVWRVPLRLRGLPKSLAAQVLKYLEFGARVAWMAWRERVALVNVHHLDLLPLGVLLKWLCGARLVFDAHELETERHGLTGTRQRLAKLIERRFISHADLVIVVSDGINRWYRDAYGLERIETVLNCPEYAEHPKSHRFAEALSIPRERKIVLYQGGLSGGRGVESLAAAFEARDDGRHVLVTMGEGDLAPHVRALAEKCPNIYFREPVTPQEVLEHTSSADVGVSFIEPTNLSYYWCLPNKLFEYLMAGLPVIVSDVPEMRRLVEDRGVGVVLTSLTPATLAAALSMIEEDEGMRARVRAVAAEYSWEQQSGRMLRAYERHVLPAREAPSQ